MNRINHSNGVRPSPGPAISESADDLADPTPTDLLPRIFHTRWSSRREEAPISVTATAAEKLESPHVGCYSEKLMEKE